MTAADLIDRLIALKAVRPAQRERGISEPAYLHLWASRAAAKGLLPIEEVPPKPPKRERRPKTQLPMVHGKLVRQVPERTAQWRLEQCHGCDQWTGRKCGHPDANVDCASKRVPTDPDKPWSRCPKGLWGAWRPAEPPPTPELPCRPLRRFDEQNLAPGEPGKRFNASLIEYQGQLLLAYRDGWQGSNIHIARLDAMLNPLSTHKLALKHRAAQHGREDPRLFVHNGRLHIMFIGVMTKPQLHTNVLYARLTDDFQVEAIWHPAIPRRNFWEKNHGYFSHDGTLYAVYAIAPHRILRIDGDRADWAFETPTPAPWTGGELRGGAAPVRVDDEYWHFFHGRADRNGQAAYNLGLYAFEAKPPFKILRIIPNPVKWAEHHSRPVDQYVSCLFPCGAVRQGDRWLVSSGIHDRWTEIHEYRHADLEQALVSIRPPSDFQYREHWADPGIWLHVVGLDEYRLKQRPRFGPGDVLVDVGAHIGSFAYAARRHGAGTVHCYEPFGDSIALLRHNAARMGGVEVFAAGIGGGAGRARMQAPTADNSGSGNVVEDAGGDVALVPLDEALLRAASASATGRVAALKLDCEGCEFAGLASSGRLDLVDWVCGEWHPVPGRPGWTPAWIKERLEAAGFAVELVPVEDGRGLFWGTRP